MTVIPHEVVILLAGIGIANIVSTSALIAFVLFRRRKLNEFDHDHETEIEQRRRH